MNAPTDCRRCGVCCFSRSERFVRVTGNDWTRLGGEVERVAHFVGHRAFMRMRDGHCGALEVRHPPDGAPDFFCTLYDRRPQICRDLARGSPECAGERATKGALTAVHQMGAHAPDFDCTASRVRSGGSSEPFFSSVSLKLKSPAATP